MDINPFLAGGGDVAVDVDVDVITRYDRRSHRAIGNAARRGQANDGENVHLRTRVRQAIIAIIAHPSPAQIAPEIPPQETRP